MDSRCITITILYRSHFRSDLNKKMCPWNTDAPVVNGRTDTQTDERTDEQLVQPQIDTIF